MATVIQSQSELYKSGLSDEDDFDDIHKNVLILKYALSNTN